MPMPNNPWLQKMLAIQEELSTFLGNVALTSDGEIMTSETERENDVWSVYFESGIVATKYILLIDLDNPLFPHIIQGQNHNRIDITSVYYSTDLTVSASFQISLGVIVRINNVNADMRYFTGIPILTGANQEDQVVSLRGTPSQVKLDMDSSGVLQHGVSNLMEQNIAAVNTGLALDSPLGAGSVHPGRGDAILKITRLQGTLNFGIFTFYHAH